MAARFIKPKRSMGLITRFPHILHLHATHTRFAFSQWNSSKTSSLCDDSVSTGLWKWTVIAQEPDGLHLRTKCVRFSMQIASATTNSTRRWWPCDGRERTCVNTYTPCPPDHINATWWSALQSSRSEWMSSRTKAKVFTMFWCADCCRWRCSEWADIAFFFVNNRRRFGLLFFACFSATLDVSQMREVTLWHWSVPHSQRGSLFCNNKLNCTFPHCHACRRLTNDYVCNSDMAKRILLIIHHNAAINPKRQKRINDSARFKYATQRTNWLST